MEAGMTYPQAPAAESAVLSAIIQFPHALQAGIENGLCEPYFFNPAHKTIYKAILDLEASNRPHDFISLTQALADGKELQETGGAAYISELQTEFADIGNIQHHIEILKQKHILRQILAVSEEYRVKTQIDQGECYEILSSFSSRIAEISAPTIKVQKTFKDALSDKVDRMQSDNVDHDLILTGIKRLDETSPLRKGDMPLIVGEKKAGKSILSLTIAENILDQGHRGIYFSLEDRTSKVVDRLTSGQSRIPAIKHHMSRLSEGESRTITNSISKMAGWKLDVRDDVQDLDKIVAVCKNHKTKYPDLSFATIDYAQLVRVVGKKGGTREQEVATISRTFRLLSIELEIVIFLLSQVNKDGEARESKGLENDTTACWQLEKDGEDETKRLLAIPYQRNGESGIAFPVTFLGHIARVENYFEQNS